MNIRTFRFRWIPMVITSLREGYSRQQFFQDATAGVIVGVVALPLAIAFAIASGVNPQQGLVTAIIAGFLISLLGGTRVQIGGPTGAFIVVVYGIVGQYGYDGLVIATMMAGVMLVTMGLAGLGSVIKFVPYPVTVGFTGGIALIIATSQVRDFLGLQMDALPADFLEKIAAYSVFIDTWNPAAAALGTATVVIMVWWRRITPRVPGSLVAILATTLVTAQFHLPVETIGSRFGSVPSGLSLPVLPHFDWEIIRSMFSPALTIALLAAIESLLSAVVADGMCGTRHRSDQELIGQGVANIVTPLFGGIPATGAIARTATNIKSGGRTPVAGMVHALTLVMIMLFAGRWASLIPIPALAGILLVVAYNMSEWRLFVRLFRSPRSDVLVLLTTFFLTVVVDLTVALESGMILAAFLFMRRMADLSQSGFITSMLQEEEVHQDQGAIARRRIPEGVEVFEIYGAFFFGAASKFQDAVFLVETAPRVLILRLREVIAMDATAIRALEDLVVKCGREGTALVLSGIHAQPLVVLKNAGLLDVIGQGNICGDIDEALLRAETLMTP